MKIVFSRKGFDSSFGGCPSPIVQDTMEMMSFPIPGGLSPARFSQITTPWGNMGDMAAQLAKRPALQHACAHLDPDLSPASRPRQEGWRGSLGQVDAAQSHLAKQGVGVGDLFLFFGWFRPVEQRANQWSFVKGAPDCHALFGFMQVGEILNLGATPDADAITQQYPWLHDHPHLHGERSDNNTLYLASSTLTLNGQNTGLPGYGAFPKFSPDLRLTAQGCSKSVWSVPSWLAPDANLSELSYHKDPERWSTSDNQTLLRSVAKGQEFVFDTHDDERALSWIKNIVGNNIPHIAPARSRLNAR